MLNVPKELKLMSASQISSAIVQNGRTKVKVYPTTGQVINNVTSGGDILEFRLPSSAHSIDLSTLYIHGNIQITKQTATDFAYVQDSIESIIEQLTITIGNNSQEIENIKHYNRLQSALDPYCSSDFVNSFGGSCMALGLSVSERKSLYNIYNSVDGNRVSFSIPLRLSGVSNPAISIMPGNVFNQSSFMMIRIKLAPASSCLCAYSSTEIAISDTTPFAISGGVRTASTASYTLRDLSCTFDMVQTSNEYQQMMQEFLASNSLQYPIKTWDVNIRNLPAGQASHIETLTLNYKDIDAIFFFFNRSDELRQWDKAGEDRLHVPSRYNSGVFAGEKLKSIQLKINGVNVPNSAINMEYGGSEAFCHTIEALGLLHQYEKSGGLNFKKNVSTHFVSSPNGTVSAPIYTEVSSDRFYGRMKTVNYSSGLLLSNIHDITSNVKNYGETGEKLITQTNAELNPLVSDESPSNLLIGLNLRRLLDLEPDVLSGTNLQGTSGGITYEIQYTDGTNVPAYELGVACLHTRFINFTPSGANVDF